MKFAKSIANELVDTLNFFFLCVFIMICILYLHISDHRNIQHAVYVGDYETDQLSNWLTDWFYSHSDGFRSLKALFGTELLGLTDDLRFSTTKFDLWPLKILLSKVGQTFNDSVIWAFIKVRGSRRRRKEQLSSTGEILVASRFSQDLEQMSWACASVLTVRSV